MDPEVLPAERLRRRPEGAAVARALVHEREGVVVRMEDEAAAVDRVAQAREHAAEVPRRRLVVAPEGREGGLYDARAMMTALESNLGDSGRARPKRSTRLRLRIQYPSAATYTQSFDTLPAPPRRGYPSTLSVKRVVKPPQQREAPACRRHFLERPIYCRHRRRQIYVSLVMRSLLKQKAAFQIPHLRASKPP